jgi:hypothetical protein
VTSHLKEPKVDPFGPHVTVHLKEARKRLIVLDITDCLKSRRGIIVLKMIDNLKRLIQYQSLADGLICPELMMWLSIWPEVMWVVSFS